MMKIVKSIKIFQSVWLCDKIISEQITPTVVVVTFPQAKLAYPFERRG